MSYAFENGSGLQSIEIPSSVRLMTNHVFDVCNSLKDIYYGGTIEEWKVWSIITAQEWMKQKLQCIVMLKNNHRAIMLGLLSATRSMR